jgi:hypothetical protein
LRRRRMDSFQIAEKEALAGLRSKKGKKKSKPRFKVRWVKWPVRWAEALRQSKSVNTYRLALTILIEAFKREQIGGPIVLSEEVVKIPSSTRARAIAELVRLGLIKVERCGKQTVRVINIRTR